MCGSAYPDRGSDPRRDRLRELCGYLVEHWRPSLLYGMVLDVVEALASWVAWAEDMRGEELRKEASDGVPGQGEGSSAEGR